MTEGPGEYDRHLTDEDDDDDEDTVPCPSCGESIWAEAEKCPHCGHWLTGQAWRSGELEPGTRGKPWWWWTALGMLILFLVYLFTFGDIL